MLGRDPAFHDMGLDVAKAKLSLSIVIVSYVEVYTSHLTYT